MKKITTTLIIMATTTLSAIEPSERFMDALAKVESNCNAYAIGDKGKARGAFQMWKVAWTDVSNYRRERGLKVHPYRYAHDPHMARVYAQNYAELQRSRMIKATGRDPNAGELYALYNLGYAGFKRRGFRLNQCPKVTRVAASKIQSSMQKGK